MDSTPSKDEGYALYEIDDLWPFCESRRQRRKIRQRGSPVRTRRGAPRRTLTG